MITIILAPFFPEAVKKEMQSPLRHEPCSLFPSGKGPCRSRTPRNPRSSLCRILVHGISAIRARPSGPANPIHM